ncbi:MAG: anaerobic ribonucleoside-triphosphate reductase activating protein [Clostridiaceae bacterium]|jgi:pyruvate formate lyase activating enzyme|nr:anaerobic ribonucleoside-triphosphate reductase activating protein [Clostridiaceae bacterium]
MQIGGLQKTSLLDYPKKISAIVFTKGCNFKCGYCHNPELFSNETSSISEEVLFEFLQTRIGKLDGVVITGGEPTLQKDLPEFIKKIKDLKFLVKLDTNGTNPIMLEQLLKNNLLDYVAMDIKAPIEKYRVITNSDIDTKKIHESINLILQSKIGYEFRTTVVKEQLEIADFEKIGQLIKDANTYYLQRFLPTKTYDKSFVNMHTYSDEEFSCIKQILQKYIKNVFVRG